MAVDFPDHPFWDFSIKVYMTDGVGPACLVLQDRHEIDVNILMFCAWLGASGRGALSADEMAGVMGAVDQWHETVVRQIRAVRQRMKGGMPPAPQNLSDPLRSRINKIEIDCEHVEQLMLAASVDQPENPSVEPEQRAADAVANIRLFFDAHGARVNAGDREALLVILSVAFGDVEKDRLMALCGGLTPE